MAEAQAATQLYMTVDAREASAASGFLGVARRFKIASARLILPGSGYDQNRVQDWVANLQTAGVAVLIDTNVQLAKKTGADGVHIGWDAGALELVKAARNSLAADAIIGADAGRSRHDAMELGEAGASYIAFGIPDHVEGRVTASRRQIDLVRWWHELFEIPCVALDIADRDHAANLAVAGADFIGFTIRAGQSQEQCFEIAEAFANAAAVQREAVTS